MQILRFLFSRNATSAPTLRLFVTQSRPCDEAVVTLKGLALVPEADARSDLLPTEGWLAKVNVRYAHAARDPKGRAQEEVRRWRHCIVGRSRDVVDTRKREKKDLDSSLMANKRQK